MTLTNFEQRFAKFQLSYSEGALYNGIISRAAFSTPVLNICLATSGGREGQ